MDQSGHRVGSVLQGTLVHLRLANETEEKSAQQLSETPLLWMGVCRASVVTR